MAPDVCVCEREREGERELGRGRVGRDCAYATTLGRVASAGSKVPALVVKFGTLGGVIKRNFTKQSPAPVAAPWDRVRPEARRR